MKNINDYTKFIYEVRSYDANPSEPMYMVADNATDRLYSFWVPDEDLESVLENPS